MIRYVIKKEKGHPELTPMAIRWYHLTAWNALSVWILAGILAFFAPTTARIIFILIFVFQFLINRYYGKKKKKQQEST